MKGDHISMDIQETISSSMKECDVGINVHDGEEDASAIMKDSTYFYLLTIILPLGLANVSDATEILCLSYILSDSTFQSTVLQGSTGGALAGAIFCGMLVGGILLTILGEAPIHVYHKTILVGRRRPLILIGLAINSIAGFASAFASNESYMILIRSMAGLGIGISVPPTFTLVSELSPDKMRGFCVSLVASFWMIGSIFVSIIALLIFTYWHLDKTLDAWRVFAMICALPSFVAFILVFIFIPESPRYLRLHHYWDEAHIAQETLSSRLYSSESSSLEESCHPNNQHVADPLISSSTTTTTTTKSHHFQEIQEVTQSPLHERVHYHHHHHQCGCLTNLKSLKILYSDTSLARGTTLPLNMLWFLLCFGSYGLFTWINSIFAVLRLPNVYIQSLLFALANLPGNIVSAILVDRIGRKKLLISSMLLSALSLILLALFAVPLMMGSKTVEPTNIQTISIVLSACSFQACIICSWNMIDCLTSESFPTNVRNSGMALCTAWGRIGAMLAQFVNGYLISSVQSPISVLLIASVFLLIGSSVPLWMGCEDMTLKPLSDFNQKSDDMEISEESYNYQGENNKPVFRKRSEDYLTLLPGAS